MYREGDPWSREQARKGARRSGLNKKSPIERIRAIGRVWCEQHTIDELMTEAELPRTTCSNVLMRLAWDCIRQNNKKEGDSNE